MVICFRPLENVTGDSERRGQELAISVAPAANNVKDMKLEQSQRHVKLSVAPSANKVRKCTE